MVTPAPAIVLVDWGTTSFRLWLVDANGDILSERRSKEGMQNLSRDGFEPALAAHLEALKAAYPGLPRRLPVLMCGMVGARQGWVEAPYLDVPASLDALAKAAVPVPSGLDADIRLLPGLARRDAARPDVMRGEETQLFGLMTGDADPAVRPQTVVMPGTHSKWVELDGGRITDFTTAMTGELFAVLGSRSILSHALAGAAPSGDPESAGFRRGLERARGLGLSRGLFAVRADSLLNGIDGAGSSDALSGFLIGREIADNIAQRRPERVTLVASGTAAALYGAAISAFGLSHDLVDADRLSRTGLMRAAAVLWPSVLYPASRFE